jgi:hypothetical protein
MTVIKKAPAKKADKKDNSVRELPKQVDTPQAEEKKLEQGVFIPNSGLLQIQEAMEELVPGKYAKQALFAIIRQNSKPANG